MIIRSLQALLLLGILVLPATNGLRVETEVKLYLSKPLLQEDSAIRDRITKHSWVGPRPQHPPHLFLLAGSEPDDFRSKVSDLLPQHVERTRRVLKKKNSHHGHFFHGKGKGSTKAKGGKSKKSSKKKSSKATSMSPLPNVCSKLDFRSYYLGGVEQSGYRGRALQFEGAECSGNNLEVARNIPDLSIFVGLVEAAALEDMFRCAGPFTVLAPTNQAFISNQPFVDFLSNAANIEDLRSILLYHILPGLYLSEAFEEGSIASLQGNPLAISLSPLMIDQAHVSNADILSCNGVLHVVTDVLTPGGKF